MTTTTTTATIRSLATRLAVEAVREAAYTPVGEDAPRVRTAGGAVPGDWTLEAVEQFLLGVARRITWGTFPYALRATSPTGRVIGFDARHPFS